MQAFWRGTRACELRANSRPLAPQCARLGGGDAFGVPSCRQGACVGLGPPSRHVNTSQTRTHDTRPHLKAVTTPPHAPRRPRPRARGQQGAGTGGGRLPLQVPCRGSARSKAVLRSQSARQGGQRAEVEKKKRNKNSPVGEHSSIRCVALRVRSRLASRGGLRWVHTCAWAHERPCRAQHGQGELERVRSPAGSRVRARGEAFGGVSAQRSPRREA